jgi:ABC-type bacteriocin/lantibiotic exporter with double-glycine peptidase domain
MYVLAAIVAVLASDVAERDGETIPECGVSSVYCCLHALGHKIPLADLHEQFRALRPDVQFDALSLADLRRVLEENGVAAISIEARNDSLEDLPSPSILYLNPRPGADRGHFLVLHGCHDNVAEITDLTTLPRRTLIECRTLRPLWSGRALLVGDNGVRRADWTAGWWGPLSVTILPVIAAGLAWTTFWRRQ